MQLQTEQLQKDKEQVVNPIDTADEAKKAHADTEQIPRLRYC